MAMLIDLIACSYFLVTTVFVYACRDIWWLSVERQQNIAQLVVKTCRNHQCGKTKVFTNVYAPTSSFSFSASSRVFFLRKFSDVSTFYRAYVDPNDSIWIKTNIINC